MTLNQGRGVRALIAAERFDLLLRAIRLPRDAELRSRLAQLALLNPNGREHFLQQANLPSLFESLAADKAPLAVSAQVDLFTPQVISSIVAGNQLYLLIDFFASIPEPDRQSGLIRVVFNPMAIQSSTWEPDANEIIKLIDLGSSPEAKEKLVS